MMKKLLILLLALLTATSLAACSDDGEDPGQDDLQDYVEEDVVIDSYTVGESVFHFASIDSTTVEITGYEGPTAPHDVTIPSEVPTNADGSERKAVTTIADAAFFGISSLRSLVLPEGVTYLYNAFENTRFTSFTIPNTLEEGQHLQMIEISMEIASEFPYSNNVWPSDISFLINQTPVGTWTCPGNFSDVRGFYTPDWWNDDLSQYGLLKHLRINQNNCTMDGEQLSFVTLSDLHIEDHPFVDFRIQIKDNAVNKGGVTLFGNGFGNHAQDIVVNLYYS